MLPFVAPCRPSRAVNFVFCTKFLFLFFLYLRDYTFNINIWICKPYFPSIYILCKTNELEVTLFKNLYEQLES